MENGLSFLFKSDDLRALLNAPSTHVYIVASLKTGLISGLPVAVMQVQADAYIETGLPPTPLRMERVNLPAAVGCPVPPCRDPDGEITMECLDETVALLNTYKNTNFNSGFNIQ